MPRKDAFEAIGLTVGDSNIGWRGDVARERELGSSWGAPTETTKLAINRKNQFRNDL